MRRKNFAAALLFFLLAFPSSAVAGPDLSSLELPPGFQLSIFAEGVENARQLAIGDKGTIFAGSRESGKVYAVIDENKDFKADKVITLTSGLEMPVGVTFYRGDLYISSVSRILKLPGIEGSLREELEPKVIASNLPAEKHHGWKFIDIGPDGMLYVPVGAPCNICLRSDDERFASIMKMNLDGTNQKVIAHGVRNSVGFDWHPQSGRLWFTENGRDRMGDDTPPDELNLLESEGEHFAYPFCHGNGIKDPEYGKDKDCSAYKRPIQELGPHVAALGMIFYTGSMFPEEYKNQIFIAEHGSWNRSNKIGYRVTLVRLKNGKAISYEPFLTGFLKNEKVSGRPVDLLQLGDGSLLLSDDFGDRIYRITYKQPQ